MTETKTAARPRTRPYHKGNVAEDLKKTAERLLRTERFEDISARRLCREVGVAYANFYNHFPSFDYLMLDIAADGFAARIAMNGAYIAKAKSRHELLHDIAAGTVEFAVANPQLFRIMFGQIEGSGINARFEELSETALRVLARAVGGKAMSGPSLSFFAFTQGLARIVTQTLVETDMTTPAARQRFVREVMTSYLAGVPDGPLENA